MTDQSNMQKMHIPAEWVDTFLAGYGGGVNTQPDPTRIEAALSAVIPLIREDERERLALELSSQENDPRRLVRVQAFWKWLRSEQAKER